MDQGFIKATFKIVIPSIRLQKTDLKRIFYYIYKYKITTWIDNLPFYQSSNLKIAITTSFYFIEISILSASGLGYT